MKKFKNSFGVESDSVALLEAFIKEAEFFGWKCQETEKLGDRKKLYFNGTSTRDTLKINHFWACDSFGRSTVRYNLPTQWDKAIKALKETVKESKFKKGDLLNITSTDHFYPSHPDMQAKYPTFAYNKCNTGIFEFVEYITINDGTVCAVIKDNDDKVYCVGCTGTHAKHIKKLTPAQKKEYLTKYEEGDYVTITARTSDTWLSRFTGKLVKVVHDGGDTYDSINVGGFGFCTDNITIRRATTEETKTADNIIIVKFGTHSYFLTSKGKVIVEGYAFTIKDVQQVVDYLTPMGISINDYPLNIDEAEISFGCKKGTLSEAREILKAYKSIKE